MRSLMCMVWAAWLGLGTGACAAAELTLDLLDQVQIGVTSAQVHDLLKVPLQNDCTPLDLGKTHVSAGACISEKDRVWEVFTVERFSASTNPYELLDSAIKQ